MTKKTTARINPLIGDIYRILIQEKMEELVAVLTTMLSDIPYPLHIEKEGFYHALLQTIFSAAGITSQPERLTGTGRMDLLLELPTILYIVELKLNKPPKEGLIQIEMQKYYEPFLHKGKPIRTLKISFLKKKASKKESSSFAITYATKLIQQ